MTRRGLASYAHGMAPPPNCGGTARCAGPRWPSSASAPRYRHARWNTCEATSVWGQCLCPAWEHLPLNRAVFSQFRPQTEQSCPGKTKDLRSPLLNEATTTTLPSNGMENVLHHAGMDRDKEVKQRIACKGPRTLLRIGHQFLRPPLRPSSSANGVLGWQACNMLFV